MNKKSKTIGSNLITYGIVIAAYIIVEILMKTGHMSSLMKGLLVPLCIYTIKMCIRDSFKGATGSWSLNT